MSGDAGPKSWNENPCWDQKCVKETDACKADKDCNAAHNCAENADCLKKVYTSKAIQDAVTKLMSAISDCGWKACNDPNAGTCKGSCGKYLGANAKCNCDEACTQYNDCCADKPAVCGLPSCENACGDKGKYKDGTPDPAQNPCFCDDQCADSGDCCADNDKFCGGGGGADTTTAADASACKPACTGKNCGNDDGCGGTCSGPCPGGGICAVSGGKKACNTGAAADTGATVDAGTVADAGATGGVNDAGADAAMKADTAAGTQVNNGTGSSAKSSGCTATSQGPGVGWLLGLMAVCGVLSLRRRFV